MRGDQAGASVSLPIKGPRGKEVHLHRAALLSGGSFNSTLHTFRNSAVGQIYELKRRGLGVHGDTGGTELLLVTGQGAEVSLTFHFAGPRFHRSLASAFQHLRPKEEPLWILLLGQTIPVHHFTPASARLPGEAFQSARRDQACFQAPDSGVTSGPKAPPGAVLRRQRSKDAGCVRRAGEKRSSGKGQGSVGSGVQF